MTQIPEKFRFSVNVNPIAPIALAYQQIFYEGRLPNFVQLSGVAAIAMLTYLLGASVFERYRGMFAEEV